MQGVRRFVSVGNQLVREDGWDPKEVELRASRRTGRKQDPASSLALRA